MKKYILIIIGFCLNSFAEFPCKDHADLIGLKKNEYKIACLYTHIRDIEWQEHCEYVVVKEEGVCVSSVLTKASIQRMFCPHKFELDGARK